MTEEHRNPAFYVKIILTVLIVMTIAALDVLSASARPGPRAVINPFFTSYSYDAAPSFEIQTGSNRYFRVELALVKHLFDSNYGNRITSSTDVNQNFYRSDARQSTDGEATFTVPANIWRNVRGARIYYRVITSADFDDGDIRYSTDDSDWESAPAIARTGESWYGLPLNDQARIGTINVVVNGRLNGEAMSSDYGPRNVSGGSRFHPGIDIPVAKGTPVYAIADGTVVTVPSDQDQMHRLDVNHGQYRSGYVHLDKALVSLNEAIVEGQLIGYSGDWFEGEPDNIADHLHFDCGYDGGQIFHNPLDYIPHTDDHTLSVGSGTFLGDAYTHGHAIDVVNAAGNQHKALIAFGVTTSFDKDLNYVRVQVDGSMENGQYFELDYDEVTGQNSTNGVVTLSNGKTFRVRSLSDDIYGDTNLAYAFYVKPADTNIGQVAKDYFFFPWNLSPFEQNINGGFHTIRVTLREVDGGEITRTLMIGPEIHAESPTISGNQVTIRLMVSNHDYQSGNIAIATDKLPPGWTATLSNANPSIAANGTVSILLTLQAPGPASLTALYENDTRVVATFGRLLTLQSSIELVPGQVWIDEPQDGGRVEVGSAVVAVVKATDGAENVKLRVNGVEQALLSYDEPDTWSFIWNVPSEANVQYRLQAFAEVEGEPIESGIVTVTSYSPVTKVVVITSPDNGAEVTAGSTVPVSVSTDPAATSVQLQIDGTPYSMTSSGELTWQYQWMVPSGVEKEYQLKASATIEGETVDSSVIYVQAVDDTPEPYAFSFTNPTDGATIQIGQQITVTVYAPDTQDVDVDAVALSITPTDQDGGGQMTDAGSGLWTYAWTPQPTGGIEQQTYTLVASVYDVNLEKVGEELIQVFAEGVNPPDLTVVAPGTVFVGTYAPITIVAPDASSVELYLNGTRVSLRQENWDWIFDWYPSSEGEYQFHAIGRYTGGVTKTETFVVTAMTAPGMKITAINEYAFLGEIEGLKQEAPLDFGTYVPLPIPTKDYACGVVGYKARGGDIGEEISFHYVPDLIGVFLKEGWDGYYQLMADFNTIHLHWFFRDYDEDRPETWDVDILCVRKDVASITHFSKIGDNAYKDTGISIDQSVCSIAGFWAHGGDINENGTHDIMKMYLDRKDGNWYIRADFATHNGGECDSRGNCGRENWDVDLLCLDPSMASLDGPVPGKLFFLKSYTGLGDNVGAKRIVDTGYSVEDYVCGVAGFAAKNGDINEGDAGGNLLYAYLYPNDGTWHVRADFRTHDDHETWDVDIICALKEGGENAQWNISHEETGIEYCMTSSTKCQVLTQERINLIGQVVLSGGGYSGFPSFTGKRCSSVSAIEVYINDRDPGTGRPLWSWPDYCLSDGDSFYLAKGNTYDFRGVSLIGATTRPFELIDPDAPPLLISAEPRLYTDEFEPGKKYGPGMRLTWEPTSHPQAAFYEIQFSEDDGITWQVFTDRRDISYGGWINHLGDIACGHNFYRCLKRSQEYSYRVRVLDSQKNLLTDWSNVISNRSMDWPAHVELAGPVPSGPYWNNVWTTVDLSLSNTYGEDLQIEWLFHAWSGAEYQILSGCEDGSIANADSINCRIKVRNRTTASLSGESMKFGALAPAPSVDVTVMVEDKFGYQDMESANLRFRASNDDKEKVK
jgi:murein DD-endopeptidase MepM/ murein hydrolase activator NlpD